MLHKNITKIFAFVISNLAFCLFFSSCHPVASQNDKQKNANERFSDKYEKPQVVGKIESSEVTESSGLVASQCSKNVFWTHNDSGHENEIFALDREGKNLGKWKVSGAKNTDWEDIAIFKNAGGECFLYIGDIGNNTRKRGEMTIYLVREPQISAANRKTEAAQIIKFEYPDMRHDAETLLVHPQTGDIYVLSKRLSGASAVYRLKSGFSFDKINMLEKIADLSVPAIPNGFLTGGNISPDGKRVILCDYFAAYEIILPANAKNFDEIWTQKPDVIELGTREIGEAVCYSTDGNSIFATSEKKNSPFIEVKRK